MFERFTQDARGAVERAQVEAGALGAERIGDVHVLLGALAEPASPAARALRSVAVDADDVRTVVRGGDHGLDAGALAAVGVDLAAVRAQAEATFGAGALDGPATRPRQFDPAARKLLELALREAIRLHDRRIDTGHLLLAVVRAGDSPAWAALAALGLTPDEVRDAVDRVRAADAA